MRSIRSFLLINLLLSVALITSLMLIANLFLNHKKLQSNINTQLALNALTIEALLNDQPTLLDVEKIQNKIDTIPRNWQHLVMIPNSKMERALAGKISFQIWDKHGQLLLNSYKKLPRLFSNLNPGFNDEVINNTLWRTFTTYNSATGITVTTAERYDFHQDLENQIATNSIVILCLALPLLGILLWLVVGRGLASIKQVTKEVKNRDPGDLKEMALTSSIPIEIQPLVEELNILFTNVEEAFLREERFAADAAHELRTPLAALRAHVNVALNATSEEERTNTLKKIQLGIDRGTHVVQQLLTLSRTSKPKFKAKIRNLPANLNSIATEIIAEIYPLAHERKIDIELVAPKEPAIVIGDPIMLGILLKNLIDNAIRYIQEGGFIQVVIGVTQGKVTLKVTDNGPGIPKDMRLQVFERFFRGVGNTAPGAGLGLSIVQQIAIHHHAEIELKTPPSGKGLEVEVIFPKTLVKKKTG